MDMGFCRNVVFSLVFAGAVCAQAKDVACMCVYYPHWHRYPKGDEWFGPAWKQGEWTFVRDARPRFPGDRQPLRPYAGFLDESNPLDMEKDIALAANAGIDVFLYDYYYYDGKITQEAALEKGFLGARNRNRMKFALMWCYHERNDQFRPEIGKPRRRLMSLAHTPEEFQGLIALSIQRYFPRPEYFRHDGRLFFSIYNAPYFFKRHGADPVRIRAELDAARAKVRAAGLGEIHFNAQQPRDKAFTEQLRACGFDSVTDYNFPPPAMFPPERRAQLGANGRMEADYVEAVPHIKAKWAERAEGCLPYIPQVPTGWCATPRCRADVPYPWAKNDYPYCWSFTNNTANAFRDLLAAAREHAARDPKRPGLVYINGWNEYTEGTYLVPNNFDADGFLRAVASVFGRAPADEYTYVNPSTKQLFTIPAPDFADVPYGAHDKQKVDVFLPKNRPAPYPVLVYIHGGGWSGGAMEDHILGSSIRGLLAKGVAVAALGYRYVQEVPPETRPRVQGCLDDCAKALALVRAHARTWGIDASRMALAGGSAGACTALYLGLRENNVDGIAAVAAIIPQTSMDPQEMRAWIPDSTYGAHAFGYRDFDDWLANRAACLPAIARISPAALVRAIAPARAPRIVMQGTSFVSAAGVVDATHSPVFMTKFKELADARGIACDIVSGPEPCFGAALARVAEILLRAPAR
ncbi:MAG: glycoside hydrolase family 99-like domain-containing protein [Kiritimatiellia bacterium]